MFIINQMFLLLFTKIKKIRKKIYEKNNLKKKQNLTLLKNNTLLETTPLKYDRIN